MKIAILTQPLISNNGGILQAFALQKVLKDNGYSVVTENPQIPVQKGKSFLKFIFNHLFPIIKFLLPQYCVGYDNPPLVEKKMDRKKRKFIQKYISTIPLLDSFSISKYDAIIVGSDQVWRPLYNENLLRYFLSFVPSDWKGKRIAYAASLGVDSWEISESDTIKAQSLISVC